MVSAFMWYPAQEWICSQSQGTRTVPSVSLQLWDLLLSDSNFFLQWQLQGVVQNLRRTQLQSIISSKTSESLVESALHWGREGSWPTFGCSWQVSHSKKVSSSQNDLGWRRDFLLLQRKVTQCPERVVSIKSLPFSSRKERSRRRDRLDDNPSQQLVQESSTER